MWNAGRPHLLELRTRDRSGFPLLSGVRHARRSQQRRASALVAPDAATAARDRCDSRHPRGEDPRQSGRHRRRAEARHRHVLRPGRARRRSPSASIPRSTATSSSNTSRSRRARSTASRASSTSSPATAIMALFGAPVAHEDAPYRAVYAALAHPRRARGAERAAPQPRRRRAARAASACTPDRWSSARVGSDLKMDYTAIGDTTNLSQRLESARRARHGADQRRHGTAGARVLRRASRCERRERDGTRAAIVAYEVRGSDRGGDPDGDRRGPRPDAARSVGRRSSPSSLPASTASRDPLAQVVDRRRRRRQRQVAPRPRAQAATRRRARRLFEARCSAMTQAVPYAPWVTMMRQLFRPRRGRRRRGGPGRRSPTSSALPAEEVAASYPGCRTSSVSGAAATAPASPPSADELKRQDFHAVARVVDQRRRARRRS